MHSRTPSRQRDRALRAIPFRVAALSLQFTRHFLDEHDRMPDVVGIENFRRQGVTAPVADAAIHVHLDACHDTATGKVSGSDSTDRKAAV